LSEFRLYVKEVKLGKLLVFLSILIFVLSLNTQAKDAFSFEPNEYADSVLPSTAYEGIEPFITGYRDSDPEDFSIVEGKKWWHGTHSIQMCMTHEGTRWNIMAKNAVIGSQPENRDTSFLIGVENRDTMYYYVYIPQGAPIDSIFIFVRNQDWEHDGHTTYYPRNLHFGRWNELKDGISDDLEITTGIIQSDFEIHTNPEVNPPACTLYFDAISSKGRVPSQYCDTAGQAGIKIPEQGNGVSIARGSINCIKYAINTSGPVIIQVFDLSGRKQLEIPVGMQPAGTYSIPLDLPAGVYLSRVATITGEAKGKSICINR
jgi:hypothetical protein